MFKIANREKEGWLRVEDIEQFPSGDLQTIDQLWVQYSIGRFGFSVQKKIYQSLGGTKEFNQKITEAFWHRVGLIINNQPYWSQYDNLIFNLSAPIGHLPIRYDVETPEGVIGIVEGFLSRPDLVLPEVENKQSETLQTDQFETVTVNRQGEIIKTETKQAQYFTEILPNNVTLEMVAIPGGTFMMGSESREKDSYNDERPQHQVTVQPFFMGKYPVTQAQWKAIASNTDLKIERDLKPDPSVFKGDNRPVECVSWLDAVEFCLRLSKLTGKPYRLPTEAEWEYACRAGTTTPFYFGETITSMLANYDGTRTYADEPKEENRNETTPVGQFPPNAFGLYDLHGNVWEWCFDDWHDNYEGAPADSAPWIKDPYTQYLWDNLDSEWLNNANIEISKENRQLLRGGSCIYKPNDCRCASRGHYSRKYIYFSLGFRVLCRVGRTP